MSVRDTVILFEENGIFDYPDRFAGQFINRTFPYIASFISGKPGIPAA